MLELAPTDGASFNRSMETHPLFGLQGRLIAIIGLDGAGKTTQVGLLRSWLMALGYAVHSPVNESLQALRTHLDHVAERRDCQDAAELFGSEDLQLMMWAIKLNGLMKMAEAPTTDDCFTVTDRYSYCFLAAERCLSLSNGDKLRALFDELPTPNLTIYLSVSPGEATRRVLQRGEKEPRAQFVQCHKNEYDQLADSLGFAIVDGEVPPLEVHRRVVKEVRTCFGF